jgi:hypothetical protein
MLPNFIIPGPPKAGTSSLQHYIDGHPDIFIPNPEAHFFCDHFSEGTAYYDKFFEGWNGQKAIGEKTPCYFTMKEVPALIKDHIPDVKLLFIYRNPVDRAYSQYWHNVRRYVETDTFENAVRRNIDGRLPNMDARVQKIFFAEDSLFSYADIGRYSEHIQRWMHYFSSSQMMHIVLEGLTYTTLHDVLRFLEVDDDYKFGELKKYNVGGAPRSLWMMKVTRRFENSKLFHDAFDRFLNFKRDYKPEMAPAFRKELTEYFTPYNKEFEKLTGRPIEKWS